MSDIVKIDDHVAQAVAREITPFKDKPRFEALLSSHVSQMQDIEDATHEVFLSRIIDNSTGASLDVIGSIVGQSRNGASDDSYRSFIRARSRVNLSDGKIEQLIQITKLLFGTQTPIRVVEYYPATLEIEIRDAASSDANAFALLLKRARAAGVALQFIYSASDDDESFLFGDSTGGDTDLIDSNTIGSTTDATVGGDLAAVV